MKLRNMFLAVFFCTAISYAQNDCSNGLTTEYKINHQWFSGASSITVDQGDQLTLSGLPNDLPITIVDPDGVEHSGDYSFLEVRAEDAGVYQIRSGACALPLEIAISSRSGDNYALNLALNKLATQSSTYEAGTANEHLYAASNAVDGRIAGAAVSGSINHTESGASEWWQVDLGAPRHIDQIKVYNRNDHEYWAGLLAGAEVYVGDVDSSDLNLYQYIGTLDGSMSVQGFSIGHLDISARYVKISHSGQRLHMAEVEVYGSLSGPNTGGQWNGDANNITYGGNVGIGTAAQSGYQLAVEGGIRAREVKVDADNWPDYVFTAEHSIPTLEEVQQHIAQKGHLINIPSAGEVEANGIELGEMNKLLLEKIEELTLYILQQEKRIGELEKQ